MSIDPKSTQTKATVTVLRARVVLPVSRPPIENGAVVVAGNRIQSVGRWDEASVPKRSRVIDLGEMVLLPGLVNAHCHLDYTGMAGELAPTKQFIDWLKLITMSKSGWGYSDFAKSWLEGARMLVRTGTTTVGDIEMVPELLPDVWTATPLRVFSFLEMTGVKSRRLPLEILGEALAKIKSIPIGSRRMGLSPHAPYSTTPDLLLLTADAARHLSLPIVIHVAESDQEFEMYMYGEGKMYEWLERGGRDMSDCGLGSPVQHLERHGLLGKNLLAVHVNYLAPKDISLLAKRQVNIVHCPRSHTYFRHRRFALDELTAAGINVCLGTDSLASLHMPKKQMAELNLFDEMRELAVTHPELKPESILQMATKNSAAALGMQKQIGELIPDSLADLIAVPHAGKISDAAKAVVNYRGDVAASMIGGELGRRAAERFPVNDFNEELKSRLDEIRAQGLHRELRRVNSPQSPCIRMAGRDLLNFSSNDYLGLANHPRLNAAAIRAVERFGSGSGVSRLICGSLACHHELEEALAAFKNTEAALSFSSGYAAAHGVIGAVTGKDDVIVLDKLVHACIVDAARLSGAKLRIFAHNELNELEDILRWTNQRPAAAAGTRRSRTLIVTESIFSMDGDCAPLREMVSLKEKYGAWLMVDEAHAIGLYGPNRRGLAEELKVSDQIEIQMGTLGKALGSAGGYIAGSRTLIEYLINRARTFIFSTAPVPAASAAARAAVELVQSDEGLARCNQLWSLVDQIKNGLRENGWPLSDFRSAIIPLIAGAEAEAMSAASALRESGIYIPAIRYPTVARGQARLRLTLTAAHTSEQAASLLTALALVTRNTQHATRNA